MMHRRSWFKTVAALVFAPKPPAAVVPAQKWRTETFVLPEVYGYYLTYGDDYEVQEFEKQAILAFKEKHKLDSLLDISEDTWFAWSNDLDYTGGNVAYFTFKVKES
jgi:hypothetical protein